MDAKSIVEQIRADIDGLKDSAFILEDLDVLNEVEIQLNRNRDTKFGNVVILAGGAGSGKGMTLNSLLNVKGKVLDVDRLKTLAIRARLVQPALQKAFGGDHLKKDFLKNPENVSKLHALMNDELKFPDRVEEALFKSIMVAHPDRKPNLVFDVTLKDFGKLEMLTSIAENLGYDKTKIHLVWVLNTIDIAMKQNAARSRKVSEGILLKTHAGASTTMGKVIKQSTDVRRYLDGDIFINFNQMKVDNEIAKSERGGSYVTRATYIQLKQAGKPLDANKVNADLLAKIKSYVPNPEEWD